MSFGASGSRPRTRLATAPAQTLAWALAVKADFGMAPPIAASPMTWMPGTRRDSKLTGSIGHQPVWSATPDGGGDGAGPLRRDDVGDRGPVIAELGGERPRRQIDLGDPPAEGQAHPFHHAGIELLPRRLEQALLGEGVLGVEDDELGAWLPGLQEMRDQARPLIGAGRAAERIGRGGDDDEAAILHRLQLAAQQQGLLAGLPGVGDLFRRRRVIAGDGVEAQIDAGGDDEAVIIERRAVGEARAALRRWSTPAAACATME